MFKSTCVTHLFHAETFGFVKADKWKEVGRNGGKEMRILDVHHSGPGTLLGNTNTSRSRR